MIRKNKQTIAGMLLLTFGLLVCTACSENLPGDDNQTPPETGEPVEIVFDMYDALLTKADAAAPDTMAEGNTFRIYAYNSVKNGKPDFKAPVASAIYTVKKDADNKLVATGDMKLYRGTYYMYLVSYNDKTNCPELGTGDKAGKITVSNGHDFMYTTLADIVVQPTTPGGSSMTVKLPSPFIRMGSQVVVRTTAKASSPVVVSSLNVVDITVKCLPGTLDYTLGGTAWDVANGYDKSYTYPGSVFTRPDMNVTSWWTSSPSVLLPVNGSVKLIFDVNLKVGYESGTKTLTKVYPASIQKVLLPGMTYVFDFTLTFYGEIIPSDLTLAVKEYNTITLDSDDLGKI